MKISEAVLEAFLEFEDSAPSHEELQVQRLEAALEQLRGELEGDEARKTAGAAAYMDFDPTGDFDLLEEPLRMSWEGSTVAGMQAALNSVLGEAEHQGEGKP